MAIVGSDDVDGVASFKESVKGLDSLSTALTRQGLGVRSVAIVNFEPDIG